MSSTLPSLLRWLPRYPKNSPPSSLPAISHILLSILECDCERVPSPTHPVEIYYYHCYVTKMKCNVTHRSACVTQCRPNHKTKWVTNFLISVELDCFRNCKRFGQQAWVMTAIIATETLICLKFGWNIVTLPPPPHMTYFWMAFAWCWVAWTVWYFWPRSIHTEMNGNQIKITGKKMDWNFK